MKKSRNSVTLITGLRQAAAQLLEISCAAWSVWKRLRNVILRGKVDGKITQLSGDLVVECKGCLLVRDSLTIFER